MSRRPKKPLTFTDELYAGMSPPPRPAPLLQSPPPRPAPLLQSPTVALSELQDACQKLILGARYPGMSVANVDIGDLDQIRLCLARQGVVIKEGSV